MNILLIVAFVILAVLFVNQKKQQTAASSKKPAAGTAEQELAAAEKEKLPVAGAYQKKWLLTYNEKDAYKALKAICDENGLFLMTKVRLLDLVEPVKSNSKYRSYFYKVQAKHIDFVICDEKLVARCMIELDDSSHNQADRAARDQFVNEVLESVGYKVLHIKAVTEDTKAALLPATIRK